MRSGSGDVLPHLAVVGHSAVADTAPPPGRLRLPLVGVVAGRAEHGDHPRRNEIGQPVQVNLDGHRAGQLGHDTPPIAQHGRRLA